MCCRFSTIHNTYVIYKGISAIQLIWICSGMCVRMYIWMHAKTHTQYTHCTHTDTANMPLTAQATREKFHNQAMHVSRVSRVDHSLWRHPTGTGVRQSRQQGLVTEAEGPLQALKVSRPPQAAIPSVQSSFLLVVEVRIARLRRGWFWKCYNVFCAFCILNSEY